MKLRLYFRPGIAALLLAGVAALLWGLVVGFGVWLAPLALIYSILALLVGWAWLRTLALEHWMAWPGPARLLILAPHEDDCVIAAGGAGIVNRRLGGATRIAYLAPDQTPGMAQVRAEEARAAWREAGLDSSDLLHLDLLPPLLERNPARLRAAATELRRVIDDFKPTVIVTPMFEGGHIQHDMVVGLLDEIVRPGDTFEVFEAPGYGPYVSLNNTPHRVVTLCARWLFALVSYYGPPDGIDGRPVRKLRIAPADLDCKRRMLAAFRSQNAPSLMETRCYPDRWVEWRRNPQRRQPFAYRTSYLRFKLAAESMLPDGLGARLLPGQRWTIGRPGELTDWRAEWDGQ